MKPREAPEARCLSHKYFRSAIRLRIAFHFGLNSQSDARTRARTSKLCEMKRAFRACEKICV